MNKSIKKIFAVLSVCSLLLLNTAEGLAASLFKDIDSGSQYYEAVEVLGRIGIIKGDESGSFLPESKVTRAEMAAFIIRAVRCEEAAAAASPQHIFRDTEGHWAEGYIELANSMGYISGDENGNFRPDDNVTYQEALKLMVCITGYKAYAEKIGGYPSGYIITASQKGIAKKVFLAFDEEMNRAEVAQLLYDAMQVDRIELTAVSGGGEYEETDSLMDEFMSYIEKKGIITAVCETSLDSANGTNSEERVVINAGGSEITFRTGNTNAQELLGREVVFTSESSADSSDDDVLRYAAVSKNTDVITVSAADIDEAVYGKSYKYTAAQRQKTAQLSENVSYIYNNEYTSDMLSSQQLCPENGSVTLVDNNGDGKYEVVLIESYKHLVVSGFEKKENEAKLYFKEARGSGIGEIELIDGAGKKIVSVYKDGERLTDDEISDCEISEWSIASVAVSRSGEKIKVQLCDMSISGDVTKTEESQSSYGGLLYTVDGSVFEKAPECDDELKIGSSYTLSIAFDGKIAAVNTDAVSDNENYALIIRKLWAEEGDADKAHGILRLMLADGSKVSMDMAEKVKIGNSGAVKITEFNLQELETNSVIIYHTNSDGEINRIETADSSNTASTTDSYITYNKNKEFSLDASTTLYYKNSVPPTFGGDMKLDENTLVFDISSDDEISWGVSDYTLFNNETVYDIDAYNLDKFKVAGIIVNHGAASAEKNIVPWDSAALLVESNALAWDDNEGESVYRVTGIMNGKRVTLTAKNDSVCDEERENYLRDITQGSVIQVKTSIDGKINKIRCLYKAPDSTTVFETMGSRNWEGSGYSVKLHTAYGMCGDISENIITVATKADDTIRAYSMKGAAVYVFDTRKKTADIGSIRDAKPFSSYGYDDCTRVFIRMEKDTVREVVIYRDDM